MARLISSCRLATARIYAAIGGAGSRQKLNLIRFHGVLTPNAKLRSEIIPGSKKDKNHVFDRNADMLSSQTSVRISWARLLERVFEIDVGHYPHCGGNMKIITTILEKIAIIKF